MTARLTDGAAGEPPRPLSASKRKESVMTTQREHLNAYTTAVRDLELTDTAIEILERVTGVASQRCIKALKAEQQRHLKRLDVAAAKLGAPYPGK